MTSGILPVNKPPGKTSFELVRLIRRATGEKRVGHAGTLDPMATGVLLVLLGQATRITEYLMDLAKTYRATILLGVETTTYDAEGEVVSTRHADVTEPQLRDALAPFTGEIMQRPPAHSAVKMEGERAYHRARRGEAVDLKERAARIDRLDLLRFDPPYVEIEVECGRGTYIRSIAHDLGASLGCGAHLTALERTRVGPFSVEACATEATLSTAFESSAWGDLLQPVDCGLTQLPALTARMSLEQDLRHGQPIRFEEEATVSLPHPADTTEARAYAEDGSLIGIIRYDAEAALWRPRKIFSLAD
jgi:tRNA pseudouridine55 synthase